MLSFLYSTMESQRRAMQLLFLLFIDVETFSSSIYTCIYVGRIQFMQSKTKKKREKEGLGDAGKAKSGTVVCEGCASKGATNAFFRISFL